MDTEPFFSSCTAFAFSYSLDQNLNPPEDAQASKRLVDSRNVLEMSQYVGACLKCRLQTWRSSNISKENENRKNLQE